MLFFAANFNITNLFKYTFHAKTRSDKQSFLYLPTFKVTNQYIRYNWYFFKYVNLLQWYNSLGYLIKIFKLYFKSQLEYFSMLNGHSVPGSVNQLTQQGPCSAEWYLQHSRGGSKVHHWTPKQPGEKEKSNTLYYTVVNVKSKDKKNRTSALFFEVSCSSGKQIWIKLHNQAHLSVLFCVCLAFITCNWLLWLV